MEDRPKRLRLPRLEFVAGQGYVNPEIHRALWKRSNGILKEDDSSEMGSNYSFSSPNQSDPGSNSHGKLFNSPYDLTGRRKESKSNSQSRTSGGNEAKRIKLDESPARSESQRSSTGLQLSDSHIDASSDVQYLGESGDYVPSHLQQMFPASPKKVTQHHLPSSSDRNKSRVTSRTPESGKKSAPDIVEVLSDSESDSSSSSDSESDSDSDVGLDLSLNLHSGSNASSDSDFEDSDSESDSTENSVIERNTKSKSTPKVLSKVSSGSKSTSVSKPVANNKKTTGGFTSETRKRPVSVSARDTFKKKKKGPLSDPDSESDSTENSVIERNTKSKSTPTAVSKVSSGSKSASISKPVANNKKTTGGFTSETRKRPVSVSDSDSESDLAEDSVIERNTKSKSTPTAVSKVSSGSKSTSISKPVANNKEKPAEAVYGASEPPISNGALSAEKKEEGSISIPSSGPNAQQNLTVYKQLASEPVKVIAFVENSVEDFLSTQSGSVCMTQLIQEIGTANSFDRQIPILEKVIVEAYKREIDQSQRRFQDQILLETVRRKLNCFRYMFAARGLLTIPDVADSSSPLGDRFTADAYDSLPSSVSKDEGRLKLNAVASVTVTTNKENPQKSEPEFVDAKRAKPQEVYNVSDWTPSPALATHFVTTPLPSFLASAPGIDWTKRLFSAFPTLSRFRENYSLVLDSILRNYAAFKGSSGGAIASGVSSKLRSLTKSIWERVGDRPHGPMLDQLSKMSSESSEPRISSDTTSTARSTSSGQIAANTMVLDEAEESLQTPLSSSPNEGIKLPSSNSLPSKSSISPSDSPLPAKIQIIYIKHDWEITNASARDAKKDLTSELIAVRLSLRKLASGASSRQQSVCSCLRLPSIWGLLQTLGWKRIGVLQTAYYPFDSAYVAPWCPALYGIADKSKIDVTNNQSISSSKIQMPMTTVAENDAKECQDSCFNLSCVENFDYFWTNECLVNYLVAFGHGPIHPTRRHGTISAERLHELALEGDHTEYQLPLDGNAEDTDLRYSSEAKACKRLELNPALQSTRSGLVTRAPPTNSSKSTYLMQENDDECQQALEFWRRQKFRFAALSCTPERQCKTEHGGDPLSPLRDMFDFVGKSVRFFSSDRILAGNKKFKSGDIFPVNGRVVCQWTPTSTKFEEHCSFSNTFAVFGVILQDVIAISVDLNTIYTAWLAFHNDWNSGNIEIPDCCVLPTLPINGLEILVVSSPSKLPIETRTVGTNTGTGSISQSDRANVEVEDVQCAECARKDKSLQAIRSVRDSVQGKLSNSVRKLEELQETISTKNKLIKSLEEQKLNLEFRLKKETSYKEKQSHECLVLKSQITNLESDMVSLKTLHEHDITAMREEERAKYLMRQDALEKRYRSTGADESSSSPIDSSGVEHSCNIRSFQAQWAAFRDGIVTAAKIDKVDIRRLDSTIQVVSGGSSVADLSMIAQTEAIFQKRNIFDKCNSLIMVKSQTAVSNAQPRASTSAFMDSSATRTKFVDNNDVVDLGGVLQDWFDDYFDELKFYSLPADALAPRRIPSCESIGYDDGSDPIFSVFSTMANAKYFFPSRLASWLKSSNSIPHCNPVSILTSSSETSSRPEAEKQRKALVTAYSTVGKVFNQMLREGIMLPSQFASPLLVEYLVHGIEGLKEERPGYDARRLREWILDFDYDTFSNLIQVLSSPPQQLSVAVLFREILYPYIIRPREDSLKIIKAGFDLVPSVGLVLARFDSLDIENHFVAKEFASSDEVIPKIKFVEPEGGWVHTSFGYLPESLTQNAKAQLNVAGTDVKVTLSVATVKQIEANVQVALETLSPTHWPQLLKFWTGTRLFDKAVNLLIIIKIIDSLDPRARGYPDFLLPTALTCANQLFVPIVLSRSKPLLPSPAVGAESSPSGGGENDLAPSDISSTSSFSLKREAVVFDSSTTWFACAGGEDLVSLSSPSIIAQNLMNACVQVSSEYSDSSARK